MCHPGGNQTSWIATAVIVLSACLPVCGEVLGTYGESYLENVDGLRVLHLKGTPTEMGLAHGHLLAKEVQTVYQTLSASFFREMTQAEQTATAAAARPYIPARFVEEVEAIAAGANDELGTAAVSAERLLELHSWDEICRNAIDRGACAHFAALDGATVGRHVIVGVDYVDERAVSRGVSDGAVVIVYEPVGRNSFCAVTWAGFAGVMLGLNNQGLVVSDARFPSNNQRPDGVPLPFQLRRVMEESADVAAAEALLRSIRRTVTGNVLVADGVGESAVRVFEFSMDQFEVFREGDPKEDFTYVVKAKGVPVGLSVDGYDADLDLPDVNHDTSVVVARPLPNAIVRASYFVHNTGGSPLLEQEGLWFMGFLKTDPDFDFLDISGLPVTYPYPALDLMYMVDKIVAGRARELLNSLLAAILDAVVPDWEEDLYSPDTAAMDRYARMGTLVEAKLGSLDAAGAIEILGGGVTPGAHDTLRDPISLHAVAINASTMKLWIAQAPPRGTVGTRDATFQPYHPLDFGALATYPLAIQTTPVSAEVFVNDESWGQAPQSRDVRPGQYTIAFADVDGYATPPTQIVTVGLQGATVTGTYQPLHPLTVTTIGSGTVELDPPGGRYISGTDVALTAVPADGWYFDGWSGAVTGPDPSVSLTISGETAVTATFAEIPPAMYSLTVDVTGQGQVDPNGGAFPAGSAVTLSAVPARGWRFLRWEGDASGTDPNVQITFDSDKHIGAVFGQGTYLLAVAIDGEGSVTPGSGGYPKGEVLTLHATPADGRHFVEWSGDLSGGNPSATLTMDGDKQVTARFGSNPAGKRSLTVQVEGQGTVDPGSGLYDEGAGATQTATPQQGWRFVEWVGDVESVDKAITFTMPADMTIRAVFAEKTQATLNVKTQGVGQVVIDPPGSTYPLGTQVTLRAEAGEPEIEAAPIWVFDHWEGDVESDQNPLTVTLDDDVSLLAVFTQKPVDPVDGGRSCCCLIPAAPALGMILVGGVLLTSRGRRAARSTLL